MDSGTTTNLFPTKVYGAFRSQVETIFVPLFGIWNYLLRGFDVGVLSQLLNDVNGKAGIRQLTQDEINSLVGEDASSYLDTCFLTQAK